MTMFASVNDGKFYVQANHYCPAACLNGVRPHLLHPAMASLLSIGHAVVAE